MFLFNAFAKFIIWLVTLCLRILFLPVIWIMFLLIAVLFLFGSDHAGSAMIKIGNVLIKKRL